MKTWLAVGVGILIGAGLVRLSVSRYVILESETGGIYGMRESVLRRVDRLTGDVWEHKASWGSRADPRWRRIQNPEDDRKPWEAYAAP